MEWNLAPTVVAINGLVDRLQKWPMLLTLIFVSMFAVWMTLAKEKADERADRRDEQAQVRYEHLLDKFLKLQQEDKDKQEVIHKQEIEKMQNLLDNANRR